LKTIIRFTFILVSLSAIMAGSYAQQVSSGVTRSLLFSTGKDEKPVFNGSSLTLSPIGTSVTVFTSDQEGRIYVYEDGKKRGPFNEASEARVKLPEDNPEEYDPIFRKESDPDYEKLLEYNGAGQVIIRFGGKSFGPFQFILEFYTSGDKSSFYAIVMKDGKPQIITSSGNKIDLDGQPGYNYISPSGKKMMVTAIKENNEGGELINRDLSGLSAEEISKLGKDLGGKKINQPPEANIWFQDGKKFGPYDPKKITVNNPAFIKTGGENWVLTIGSKLYINGMAVKDLRNEQISPANVWLTEDGKRYVVVVYNRIEFSDGLVYNDPLKIRISINKNKITLWWLLFENGKDIVLCSKTI
jgi:hypothetical protein